MVNVKRLMGKGREL